MPRDPRRDPRKGDQLYIHAGNARRIVTGFENNVVEYRVGKHPTVYSMTITDWRVRMFGATLAPYATIEAGVSP